MDQVPTDPRLVNKRPVERTIEYDVKKPKVIPRYTPDDEIIRQYEDQVYLMNPKKVESLSIGSADNRLRNSDPHPSSWPEFAKLTPYHQNSDFYGSSTEAMVPLAYIFLGDFLSSFKFLQNGVNFKAYAVNMPAPELLSWIVDSNQFPLDVYFHKWVDRIWIDDESTFKYYLGVSDDIDPAPHCDIFRRCLIFTIVANLKSKPEFYGGHQLLIMLEIKKRGNVEIILIDGIRPDSYVHNVHLIIMDAVGEYLIKLFDTELYKISHKRSFNIEITKQSFNTIELLGSDLPYMRCISDALRVCIYLRLLRDHRNIKEGYYTFEHHKNIFIHHIHRMLHWIHRKKQIRDWSRPGSHMLIPSPSLEMLRPVFALNTDECYLSLFHYHEVPPLETFTGDSLLERLDNMINYTFANCEHKDFKFNKKGSNAFTSLAKYNPESMSLCHQMSQFTVT
jgi:hypothetical protein